MEPVTTALWASGTKASRSHLFRFGFIFFFTPAAIIPSPFHRHSRVIICNPQFSIPLSFPPKRLTAQLQATSLFSDPLETTLANMTTSPLPAIHTVPVLRGPRVPDVSNCPVPSGVQTRESSLDRDSLTVPTSPSPVIPELSIDNANLSDAENLIFL